MLNINGNIIIVYQSSYMIRKLTAVHKIRWMLGWNHIRSMPGPLDGHYLEYAGGGAVGVEKLL